MHALPERLTMIDPDEALTYLEFVAERHRIWELRQAGAPAPWTDDPVLAGRKFTNVFRVLDYGSQWLLTELLGDEPAGRETLARCFLYRHTNRPAAWDAYVADRGSIPTCSTSAGLADLLDFWQEYRAAGNRVFSGAYLVYPQSSEPGTDKVASIVALAGRLLENGTFDDFLAAETPAERFATLRRNKGVADFMSMQVLTDWGYSPQAGVDEENMFVIPGPGARRGAAFLDPRADPRQVIDWCREAVFADPRCPMLQLPDGRVRIPSLMDIQNTVCEYSKYRRHQSRRPPQKPYQPAHPGPQTAPILPRHW